MSKTKKTPKKEVRIQILKTDLIVQESGKPDRKIKNKKHVCTLQYCLPIQGCRLLTLDFTLREEFMRDKRVVIEGLQNCFFHPPSDSTGFLV